MCSVCLQDKGARLHLLTLLNREVNLSPKRAMLISKASFDTSRPRDDLLENLRNTDNARTELKAQVDAEELWELIRDEEQCFDNSDLAQLVFGPAITDDHLSALVRSLFEDRLYFKFKDGRFFPNSEDRVYQIAREREEENLRQERLKEGSLWLKEIAQGRASAEPSCRDYVVDLLVRLALYGDEDPDYKYGKELLARAGVTDIREARNILITLGIWEEDENLDLIRYRVPTSFSGELEEESGRIASRRLDMSGREDLRGLTTFTIDGELTLDFDDAVSLEMLDGTYTLGVHIADVSEHITPGSPLDKVAAERATSHYLPRTQIPMLPPVLSYDALSLTEGCDRPAVSLLATLDTEGNLLGYRFAVSVIRVHGRLTYETVNLTFDTDPVLKPMYLLSRHLRRKRLDNGALDLPLPDVKISRGEDGRTTLELEDQETPSRIMIEEFMVLYNRLAAALCHEHHIPMLYRTQPPPSERLAVEDTGHLFFVFQQLRKLSPLQIDTTPGPHSGLGVDTYTHCTSPIRRYLDLVAQRQIKAFLTGTPPAYQPSDLDEIRMLVEPTLKNVTAIKRNRLRYWIIKYLRQYRGTIRRALVLDEFKSKYRILLTECIFVSEMKKQNGTIFRKGEEILVEVTKADPWEDVLELTYAGRPPE